MGSARTKHQDLSARRQAPVARHHKPGIGRHAPGTGMRLLGSRRPVAKDCADCALEHCGSELA
eukprot:1970635-Alexandrium_andersonii.AAC.1